MQKSLPAWQQAYAAGSPVVPGVPEKIVDALVDNMTLTGSVDSVDRLVAKLIRFREAGVDEVSLRLYGQPDAAMRLVAERVVPAL